MLPLILIGLVVIVVVFLIIVALQPADFRLARNTMMSAPPAVIFERVNDFRKWDAWSPWARIDPAMNKAFEGAASGIGAIYTWTGNSKVGAGRMTILESRPDELVKIKLEFFKPFKATNTAEFTFKPEGNQTLVTWSMTGEKNFIAKAFHMFVNVDKMVGRDFEKGLAQMKAIAEAAAKK